MQSHHVLVLWQLSLAARFPPSLCGLYSFARLLLQNAVGGSDFLPLMQLPLAPRPHASLRWLQVLKREKNLACFPMKVKRQHSSALPILLLPDLSAEDLRICVVRFYCLSVRPAEVPVLTGVSPWQLF